MERKEYLFLLAFLFDFMLPLYAQHTITHGNNKTQSTQEPTKRKTNRKPDNSQVSTTTETPRPKEEVIKELLDNMTYIKEGSFYMGASPTQEKDGDANERPLHLVVLSSFYMGKYEVTQEDTFFFFNPFTDTVLHSVIGRIRKSWYEKPRLIRLLCYYPSDEFVACLMTEPDLEFEDEIDCRDLFPGDNPRERILIFGMGR